MVGTLLIIIISFYGIYIFKLDKRISKLENKIRNLHNRRKQKIMEGS